MVEEVLRYLDPKKGHTVVDCTIGEGGHAERILEMIGEEGMLVGIDRDAEVLLEAEKRFGGRSNVKLAHEDFCCLCELLDEMGLEEIDGLLFDLGVSSRQLTDPERGFSFISDGPLDMRFDRTMEKSAMDLVNGLPEKELARIIREYGEEPKARRIAREIVKERKSGPISTTGHLKDIVIRATGGRHGATHTATRTFQALRIAVNDELASVHSAMKTIPEVLRDGGRAVAISFHSLEDRIVKRTFRAMEAAGSARVLTRKAVRPSKSEVDDNPRSRSAKLRALEAVKR
jgi:16S rRNA (cytosine1402-N4)-methyltransferase